MSGTLGPAIKAAIMAALKDAPGLEGVQVEYSDVRDMDRESVYGGKIEMGQSISGGRNASGYTTRDEKGVLELHVLVRQPGATKQETESRAAAIGTAAEDFLALNTPDAPGGTLDASVEGYLLDSWYDDDAANSIMTFRIAITATIT